jgi:N-acetyl-anhydromuramyl-L-alanine amidase AmpD
MERFRTPISDSTPNTNSSPKTIAYSPREIIALAAASNYGERYIKDLSGNPANLSPIIVLHETVGSTNSVINFFQEFHTNEDNQASYHTLIAIDGTIIYFVPPDKRAFGAGNSVFVSSSGNEAVQTNPRYPSSVNNFAYHISLETPEDGMHNGSNHSGYKEAQYQSLAWLVAKTDVPIERITTHKIVDRSGSRIDPRSFNFNLFQKLLSEYPRIKEIFIGCPSARQPNKK